MSPKITVLQKFPKKMKHGNTIFHKKKRSNLEVSSSQKHDMKSKRFPVRMSKRMILKLANLI